MLFGSSIQTTCGKMSLLCPRLSILGVGSCVTSFFIPEVCVETEVSVKRFGHTI